MRNKIISRSQLKKLILESIGNYISGAQCGDVNIYHEVEDDQIELVMYKILPGFADGSADSIQIVAYFRLEPTMGPCIKTSNFDTWQVSSIHADENFQGCGYGRLIYDLAFYLAQENGHSLTSDQVSGSKEGAYDIWQKIISSDSYIKKVTEPGNNEFFDYDSSTPDPDDDCERYAYDMGINATNQSFIKTDAQNTEPFFSHMTRNHEDHMIYLADKISAREQQAFLSNILIKADNSFISAYKKSKYKNGLSERKIQAKKYWHY